MHKLIQELELAQAQAADADAKRLEAMDRLFKAEDAVHESKDEVVSWLLAQALKRKAERKAKLDAELKVRQGRTYPRAEDGYNMDVKLHYSAIRQLTKESVYWASKEANCPSYVLCLDDAGHWRSVLGERVSLVSVNGMGETRWTVTICPGRGDKEAIAAFGLKGWGPDEA